MKAGELIKLVGTIAVMLAALAVSAARTGIEAADPAGAAEVTYEVSEICPDV